MSVEIELAKRAWETAKTGELVVVVIRRMDCVPYYLDAFLELARARVSNYREVQDTEGSGRIIFLSIASEHVLDRKLRGLQGFVMIGIGVSYGSVDKVLESHVGRLELLKW